jgi:hypothetical protein
MTMVRVLIAAIAVAAAAALMLAPAEGTAEKGDCSGAGVEQLVRGVLGAFNRGDIPTFDSLVAGKPAFKWFSVSSRVGRRVQSAAFDRTSLPRYVSLRHRRGERQPLVRFSFNGRSAVHAHFDFSVIRSARDYAPKRVTGKGAVDCTLTPPRIAVWSLGDA